MAYLKKGSANYLKEFDMWRLTGGFTGDADPLLTAAVERCGSGGVSFEKIGTGMPTPSSGKWAFPSTGIWRVEANFAHYSTSEDRLIRMIILFTSNDGSAWSNVSFGDGHIDGGASGNVHTYTTAYAVVDITDTSQDKVGFKLTKNTGGSVTTDGGGTENLSYMSFTRLGDT